MEKWADDFSPHLAGIVMSFALVFLHWWTS